MSYEYGEKFDFESLKVGDTVVCTAHNWSFSGNDVWPKMNEFVFTTVKEIKDGVVTVAEGYKFKQDKQTMFGETEFFNRLKLARKNEKDFYPFNNLTYNLEYPLSNNRTSLGVSAPLYLFPYSVFWDEKVQEYTEKREKLLADENKLENKRAQRKALLAEVADAVKDEQDALDKAQHDFNLKWTEVYRKVVCPKCKGPCPFKNEDFVCDKTPTL